MKLFVWNSPYGVRYGGACLYIVAETVEQARELAKVAPVVAFGTPVRLFGGHSLGEPTRVIDLPGGECYEWEE